MYLSISNKGLLTFAVVFASRAILAQHADGSSPYGNDFAPDVMLIGDAWNSTYPPYEGETVPAYQDFDNGNETESDMDMTRRSAQDFFLRVMPLGASITQGLQSTDGNGYRKWLRSQLRFKGWKVNMVGSKQDGNMADKDNEGHPGWIIDEIHGAFQAVAYMKPNLILINAGTNDCIDNTDPGNAGSRMKVMLDDIFNSVSGVTVVVSTLVLSRDHDSCSKSVSQQIRDLVNNSYKGYRIGIADIETAMSMNDLSGDGIHPNDNGYKIFASVWWNAISKLEDGMQPPGANNGIDDTRVSSAKDCAKVAGNARGPIQSQKGSGHDDGNYVHARVERGVIDSARIQKNSDPKNIVDAIPAHMFFANVVVGDPNFARSGALDDWIRVYHGPDNKNVYYYRQNNGDGTFGPSTTFDVGMDCDTGPTYAFADFNNDGLDDFYCLKPGSAIWVSINLGGNPPKFQSLGQVVPTHDGYDAPNVRIADIDGDGRADYCLAKDDGTVICSRNGGTGNAYTWQGFTTQDGLRGTVFDKKSVDKTGIRFGDINGDFRSDYLLVGDNGNVETWINQRGWGSGIVPDWASAGITHQGQPETGIRGNIKFGRIYGSGRLDYIYIKNESTYYDVKVFENKGSGGTKRKADGDFYCDMRGTGSDDYVWIWSDGHAAEIYANVHNPPYWGPNTAISLSVPGPRIGIHLADWNGDGRCDVLVQDKASGALTLYENHYDASKDALTFVNVGVVSQGATCNQGWGVNIFDRGMRLADMDGDGRADVVCIQPNGFMSAWLNPKAGMLNVGQIKLTEGWDRSNIRLADVEGSGRADIIHLDKYTGAGTVLKNNGHKDGGGGSSFSWTNRGVLYSPIDRGETMHFTNQGGLGRADLLHVLPVSNTAFTYFNECGGGSGGDDGVISDPGLPTVGSGGGSGGGSSPPDYGNIDDCHDTWEHFEDIPTDAALICKVWNVLQILWNILNDSLNRYDDLISNGYDKKFNIFAEGMIDQAKEVSTSLPEDHGPDYFTCEVVEKVYCCTECTACKGCVDNGCTGCNPTGEGLHPANDCRYCDATGDVCKIDSPFGDEKVSYERKAEPCPPDYSQRGPGGNGLQSVYWSLRDDKADQFYKDLGVDSEYVGFTDYNFKPDNFASRECLTAPIPESCKNERYFRNFPYIKDDYTPEDVDNPKKLISGAIDGWEQGRTDLAAAITSLRAKQPIGDGVDPNNLAFSLLFPTLLVQESIGAMDKVVEKAEEIEKEKRKEEIVAWVSAILFVLPFVGVELEATGSIVLANIAKVLDALSDAGFAGIGFYDSYTTGSASQTFAALCGILAGRGLIFLRTEVDGASALLTKLDDATLKAAGDVMLTVKATFVKLLLPKGILG